MASAAAAAAAAGDAAEDHLQVPESPVRKSVVLDEDSPRVETPDMFQGELWAPQATLLASMLKIERDQAVVVSGGVLRTQTARVKAEFSFGKTILCLALVATRQRPAADAQHLNWLSTHGGRPSNSSTDKLARAPDRVRARRERWDANAFCLEFARSAAPRARLRFRRSLPTTLVIAGASVISQWERCAREFTPGLKIFTIDNVQSLRRFGEEYRAAFAENDTAPSEAVYDIILLKAGTITSNYEIPGESPGETSRTSNRCDLFYSDRDGCVSRTLTSAFRMTIEGCQLDRVVLDDLDTLPLNGRNTLPPARFTWIVSATDRRRNCTSMSCGCVYGRCTSRVKWLRAKTARDLMGLTRDPFFKTALAFTCEPDYVKRFINTTTVAYRTVTVEGGRILGMLADLDVPAEVLEMAAGGAVETAAERLNIKAASVGDLIARVLDAHMESYRRALRVRERAAEARRVAEERQGPPNSEKEMVDIRRILKKGSDAEAEEALARVGAVGDPLLKSMASLAEWADKSLGEVGGKLQRMRDNVREDQCQACSVPIEDDEDSYIINCCQIVICGECAVGGLSAARGRYVKRCPNCLTDVRPAVDLIYVGKDLKLTDALTDDHITETGDTDASADAVAATDAIAGAEAAGAAAAKYEPWDRDTRLRALLQIVENDPIECVSDEATPPFVQGLLSGLRDIPHPAGAPHRYLIFAMHAESGRVISDAFGRLGIGHRFLSGPRGVKDATITAFHAGEFNILIATSSRDCAGMHLPQVTRIVMYHRHIDNNIARQAVGRAQRVGRESSLEVIQIVDEGEIDRARR